MPFSAPSGRARKLSARARRSTVRARPCQALLALGLLLLASPARGAELVIAAPSACPIGAELSIRAEREFGQPLDSAAEVRCTVHIRREGAAYAARLEVQALASPEPARLRAFSAPSCEVLTETLALAVSLAITSGAPHPPSAAPASEASPVAPGPGVAAAPAADATDASERGDVSGQPPAVSSADGWRFGASAALVADAGTLPGLGAGASLGASLGLEAFDLRVLGTYLPPRDAHAAAAAGSGSGSSAIAIELYAGSLLACMPRLVRASDVAFGACAGAELGWLWGTSRGVTLAGSGGSWWTAARADAEARWTLAQGWSLDLRLSALVPWDRDQFAIAGIGRVFRTAAVAGRASFGLTYELGAASR